MIFKIHTLSLTLKIITRGNVIIPLIILLTCSTLLSQEEDFVTQYNSGNYQNALQTINKRLEEIYIERIEIKKIPSEFVGAKEKVKLVDLRLLFKNRKVAGFFIEENKEISDLHLYAGKCYYKISKYKDALNHYVQSLRFKNVEFNKDDVTFYEIAQIYKKLNYFEAYVNSLEAAYMLNSLNSKYSLELGLALYPTNQKKRAIQHIELYIKNTDDAIDPELYLKLGNLYEDIKQYLQTEKYYIEYLKNKPDNGSIQLALGALAYHHTGNYKLSIISLNKALEIIPEKDIFKKSLAYEIMGDIKFHTGDYLNAIQSYESTIQYQDSVKKQIDDVKKEITQLKDNINRLKKSLFKEKLSDDVDALEYQSLTKKKAVKEQHLIDMENQFKKLNAGRIRWNIADAYDRLEDSEKAVFYYREAISYNYKSNEAREKIIKLKLKIKRGY